MKTFKEFVAEQVVTASKRQGMKHFQDMKPVEFIRWIQGLDNGVLKNIKTVLKVDGLGFRWGLDANGKVFVEGSRTGPVYDDAAFSTHAINKGSSEEIVVRAKHYDDMLVFFKSWKPVKELPKDTKIYCEIFYNPMAEQDESSLKFVTVRYDKSKLGSLMTILPYKAIIASTGEDHPDNDQILKDLRRKSDSKVKVIDPSLKMGEIDINGMIDPIKTLDDDAIRVLSSRKKADKPEKEALLQIIDKVKQEIYDNVIFNKNIEGLEKLCDPEDNEGICLYLPHGTFKMTSKKFQQDHHGAKQ